MVERTSEGVFGKYDPQKHTYAWLYESLASGLTTDVELEVQIWEGVAPNTTITNRVTIDSTQTSLTTASVDVVVDENLKELESSH